MQKGEKRIELRLRGERLAGYKREALGYSGSRRGLVGVTARVHPWTTVGSLLPSLFAPRGSHSLLPPSTLSASVSVSPAFLATARFSVHDLSFTGTSESFSVVNQPERRPRPDGGGRTRYPGCELKGVPIPARDTVFPVSRLLLESGRNGRMYFEGYHVDRR